MFCGKCGKQNPDYAKFCEGCGGALAPAPTGGTVTGETPTAGTGGSYNSYIPPKNDYSYSSGGAGIKGILDNKMSRLGLIAVMGVVAVALLIWGIASLFGSSPEDPIKYLIQGIEKGKMDTVLKAFPKDMREIIEDNPMVYNMLEEGFEEISDEYEGAKYTYKIVDEDHYTDREVEEFNEDIEDSIEASFALLGGDEDIDLEAKEVCDLEVELTVKEKNGDKEDLGAEILTVAKIGGKWYLVEFGF